jgi:Family of unknown function (DUF6527)
MSIRAKRLTLKGDVVQRHEADGLLNEPGAAVLVRRGVLRSIAIACPDGCGENLTINLDPRTGPAWRYYGRGSDVSLFPSIWRDSGCRSHFIVWRSRIYWCDWSDELETPMEDVIGQVRNALTPSFIGYVELSDQLSLVPWAVLAACNCLCRRGIAVAGLGKQQGQFKRALPAE